MSLVFVILFKLVSVIVEVLHGYGVEINGIALKIFTSSLRTPGKLDQ